MTRSESALDSARLGLLLGLAEAAAILPYDLVQGQREVAVLAAALAWALAIVAVNAGLSGLLGALHRRPSWVTAVIIGLAVGAARAQSQDRFEWQGLLALLPAFGLAYAAARRPALLGLAAAFLAAAGLWARVPIYTSALDERLLALLPGLLLAGVAGAAPISGATARRLGAASLALGLGLGGLVALRPQAAQAEGGAARPNILFVLVDTTRRDHIGPHGERATPATRRLASEGVELADAVTVIPKTTQSVAAYQTGKYPIHNGVRVLKDELRPTEQTLAETLQAEGYRTAAFVHNGWVMRGRGFEQGFDRFWSFFELERAYGPLRLTGLVTALDRLSLRAIRNFDGNTDSAVATDAVIDWLDDNAGQGDPFYVYAHYFDPHWPYRPPGRDGDIVVNTIDKHKVKTKSGRKAHVPRGQMIFNNPLPDADNAAAVELYGAEVDHNTDQVGRILDWLDAHDLARDTIVVFTADHGHHLGDHNYWYHHGELLYEPGIGVPMLLRYPAGLPAGKRVAEQFRSVDVMPTLLALAGLPLPEGLDGLPLATIEEKGAPPAFLETDISYFAANKRRYVPDVVGKVRGVRMGRWKLHYTPKKGGGLFELYDLSVDPAELDDLIARCAAPPALLTPLLGVLRDGIPAEEQAALAKIGNRFEEIRCPDGSSPAAAAPDAEGAEGSGAALDENERAMLEALGYIEN